MLLRRTSLAPVVVFLFGVAVIYGVSLFVLGRLAGYDDADLMAAAVTLDLTLLVPLLYWLTLVRWRGLPAISVLPIFVGSVILAGWLIPEARQQVLDLVSYAAGLAELVLVGLVVHRVVAVRRAYRKRASAGLDVYEALRDSATAVLGRLGGSLLAYEIAVFYFAVAGWGRTPDPGGREFTSHRESAYVPFAVAVMIAVVIETVGIHLLVQMWSTTAAWILTALSFYAALWVIGDTHAIRARRTELRDGRLLLRVGLRWTAEIPMECLLGAAVPESGRLPRKTPGYLCVALVGPPNRRLELGAPVEVCGPYGIRREVTTLDLQIDGADRFDSLLQGAGSRRISGA